MPVFPPSGKRRNLLAMLMGLCATLTLPPFYLFPLAVPAYGGLFILLTQATTRKRAIADGFFWGWGFFISGLYWFCIALLTEPEKFAWLIPFALFALTALIALFTAFFAAVFFQIRRWGIIGALLFATLWTLVEYGRGHLFSGFPWNLAGYAFNASDMSLQLSSVVGVYGLTFLAVLFSVCCVLGKRAVMGVAVSVICISAWGGYRLQQYPTQFVEGVALRLVQAGIEQHHKWNPELQMQGLREHVLLTQSEGIEAITHVIWPETAVPYVLRENSTLARRLGESLHPEQILIAGALRVEESDEDYSLFNAIMVMDAKGDVVGHYDKHKLVPFGEFLPLRSWIPEGWKTPVGDRDFAAGAGYETLEWAGLPPVTPLICYEVIFPALAVGGVPRPEWLLSVTNDAWFGRSTAPYQHLAMARMRAVEQGIPMVRVANTGISAVFDAYGREMGRIDLGKKGVLDIKLPAPSQNRTVYRRLLD